jgi:hypothetical protein
MAPAAGLLLRPAANSSHSSACERAIRAASRARPATRRSCPASSFRFACSCLSACASASAALCSRVTAVRLSTDAGCAARTRVPVPHAQQQLLEVRQPRSPSPQQSWHLYPAGPLRSSQGHLALLAHVHDARRRGPADRPCAGVSESERRRTAITWSAVDAAHVRPWWRSRVARVRSLSRAICSALSSMPSAALAPSGARAAVGACSWT